MNENGNTFLKSDFNSNDPYDILGVTPNNSFAEITSRRNELVKIYHPDLNTSSENYNIIQKINDAYEQIKKKKENHLELNEKMTSKIIPGTNIPVPRKKEANQSFEEYEKYLKQYYSFFGINNKVEYYPNTNIPKPRAKYPHEILDNVSKTDPYYDDMLKYYAHKYSNVPSPKELVPSNSNALSINNPNNNLQPYNPPKMVDPITKIDDEKHEVKGIRKAVDFLKKHKKQLLIAAGLAAFCIVAQAYLIPALMSANSTLWANTSVPIIKEALHGFNLVLGKVIGASYAPSGLWTSINGALINAEAAKASVLAALTLNVTSVGALGFAAKKLVDKVLNKFKTNKNTSEEVQNNENNKNEDTNDRQLQLEDLKNQKLLLEANNNRLIPIENVGGIQR